MRHVFTKEECRRGGKARAQQESFVEACSKGFWTTMERHPFFARHYLKSIIREYNQSKQQRVG
jgi:hypothetical protein